MCFSAQRAHRMVGNFRKNSSFQEIKKQRSGYDFVLVFFRRPPALIGLEKGQVSARRDIRRLEITS